MTDHLTLQQLQEYRQKTSDIEQLLRADTHLGACPICQKQLRIVSSVPMLPQLIEECDEALHLEYEQMTAYIDAHLDEQARHSVDRHVSICSRCAKELRDLQQFDVKLSAELATTKVPHKEPSKTKKSFLQRISEMFAIEQWSWSQASAVTVMIIGAVGLASLRVGSAAQNAVNAVTGTTSIQSHHGAIFYGSVALIVVGAAYFLTRKK